MTIEEVKSRLRRYNELCRECRKVRHEIARRRADMTSPRAVKADALPGGRGNSLEAAIEKIDALEHRLRRLESDAVTARHNAEALITLADDPDGSAILRLHYIDGVRFEDVPERLYISPATMWRRYNQTIKIISEKLKNDSE